MSPKRPKNAGFALVSALMAGVILCILMTGFMGLFKSQMLVGKELTLKSEHQSLIDSVKIVLANPSLCAESLFDRKDRKKRARFNPEITGEEANELGAIRLGDHSIAEVGLQGDAVKVEDLKLREMDPKGRENLGDTQNYIATLSLVTKKIGKRIGSDTLIHTISLLVTTQKKETAEIPKDTIVSCSLSPERRIAQAPQSAKMVVGKYRAQCQDRVSGFEDGEWVSKNETFGRACKEIQKISLPGRPLFVQVIPIAKPRPHSWSKEVGWETPLGCNMKVEDSIINMRDYITSRMGPTAGVLSENEWMTAPCPAKAQVVMPGSSGGVDGWNFLYLPHLPFEQFSQVIDTYSRSSFGGTGGTWWGGILLDSQGFSVKGQFNSVPYNYSQTEIDYNYVAYVADAP